MSPELETLDQLLSGDLGLNVICALFGDNTAFVRAVSAMLQAGEVRLLTSDGLDVPRRRWSEVLVGASASGNEEKADLKLSITEAGARRVG